MKKTYRLTPLGIIVLVLFSMIIGLSIYVFTQPKQVEVIYKQVQNFFIPSQLMPPPIPN